MFDVSIIGGGVVGGLILRELTKYKLNVCLVEKAGDVAMGKVKQTAALFTRGLTHLWVV